MHDPAGAREAREGLLRRLGWLFPATYVIHIAEEWAGGFVAWFARLMGAGLTEETFLALNLWALAGMTVGVALAYSSRKMRWLLVSFAAVTVVNGAAHLAATVLTSSYSPGVISGTLIWLPLGLLTLKLARAALKRRHLVAGLLVGALMHAAVTLLALFG